ncbi:reverse transcriptase domain-containing protein [Tanacetum coccineum]
MTYRRDGCTYLFHLSGVTHDAVILRVFPITLKGPTLRWINRLSVGLVATWDLLEKAFIRQYFPPFKTTKKIEIIRNFKQNMDKTLYHAWERYNDILFKCPQHDLNNHQKVQIFYTGLDISTRIMLNSKGFLPLMTPTQTLKSIQVMADHSRNWYDEATTKERIKGGSDDVDIKQLDENIHVFQVIKQNKYMRSLEETIIKFCEDSIKEQATDDEWIRKFIENTDSNIRALKTTTKNLKKKTYQLTQTVLTNTGEKFKARMSMGKENVKETVPRDLPVVHTYVPPMKFLGSPSRTHETICMMGILEEIHKMKAQEDEGNTDDG